MTASDLASVLIVCCAVSLAVCLGSGSVSVRAIALIGGIDMAALMIGRAAFELIALPFARGFRPFADRVLGTCIMSLAICITCVVFNISAGVALLAGMAGGIAAAVYNAVRWKAEDPCTRADLLALTVICVSALVWSWEAIQAMPRLQERGTFLAWSDFFIHAGEITQFAHFSSLGGTSVFASGAALPLYHYASYMLPAALCSLEDVPALVAATAFWTPFGFILLGLSADALGSVLGGKICGRGCAAMLLAVPSASHYGLKNPFFDFHWLLQISPTGSYAVSLSLLVLGLIVLGLRSRSGRACWAAAALSFGVSGFRVHIFIPLAATGLLLLAIFWRPRRRWVLYTAWTFFVAACASALVITELIPRAPHFLSDAPRTLEFLGFVHNMQPTAYAGLYDAVAGSLPVFAVAIFGIALLLPAAFGALFPAYLFGLWWLWRNKSLTPDVSIPLCVIAAFLTMLVVFPASVTEPDELYHRPFVLVYVVLSVWCMHFAVTATGKWPSPTIGRLLSLAFSVSLCAVPLLFSSTAQNSGVPWGVLNARNELPRGLLTVAAYLRERAQPGEVVATPEDGLSAAFVALSERAAFLPGSEFLVIQSGLTDRQLDVRRAIVSELARATSIDIFRRIARSNRIHWFVGFPGTQLSPAVSAMVAKEAGGFRVIETNTAAAMRESSSGANPTFGALGGLRR